MALWRIGCLFHELNIYIYKIETHHRFLLKVTEDIAYANSLGIEVGGYDLIALTRQVEQQWMAVNQLEYPRQAFEAFKPHS
jgi:hypothetical protein